MENNAILTVSAMWAAANEKLESAKVLFTAGLYNMDAISEHCRVKFQLSFNTHLPD